MNTQFLSTSTLAGMAPVTQANTGMDKKALHEALRRLWQDQLTWTRFIMMGVYEDLPDLITWTRLVIIGAFEDLPDLDPTVQRLLQTRAHIGDAIKPFYGEAAGEQLTALFQEHILIAAEVLQAAKNGDTVAQNDATKRWYTNSDDIALFLNGENPKHWLSQEMKVRMRGYLECSLKGAVAFREQNYKNSVAAYHEVRTRALEIADMLSEGIIMQFPDAFRGDFSD